MTTHADKQTVAALRRRDEAAFRLLYTAYYPMVERLVVRNHGTVADAADVFQDTLLVLVDKLEQDNWALTASLKTYIYAVAHKLWLKQLAKAERRTTTGLDELPNLADDPTDAEWTQTLSERMTIWFSRITAHCQALIRRIFFEEKKPVEAGYKNAHTAHNQRYKCLEQIRRVANKRDLT